MVRDVRTSFYQFKLLLIRYLRQLSTYEKFATQRKRERDMEYIMLLKYRLLDSDKSRLRSWTYAQLLQLWEWQWSVDGKAISVEGKSYFDLYFETQV